MKIIAFYLPQYHRTSENDKWWEEGFTEWTNVKRAKIIYRNQVQPKIPLNNNYYDLMDKSTIEWQTNLMHQYGIYGFCYFHYWFTGKKLLHRPAENLLKWQEIKQPFCFAWANSTWARTWTAYNEATTDWTVSDRKATGDGVLLEQTYGTKIDWIKHYNYLRQFFMDERYIKVGNKPVFLIYHIENIKEAVKMFEVWDQLSHQDGFGGLHIISINTVVENNPYVEAVARYGRYMKYDLYHLRECKRRLLSVIGINDTGMVLKYERVWKNMIKENPIQGIKTYPGAVVTYDETPRRGKNAIYLKGASPQLFEKYLHLQIEKTKEVYRSEFLFLDAWNEWGEGNYLEPDEENGYAYLDAVKNALRE